MSTHELRELQGLAANGNIGWLTPKERAVIILRLGWDRPQWDDIHSKTAKVATPTRSQTEVAEHLGLSQPYVSNLERQAKDRLRSQTVATRSVA